VLHHNKIENYQQQIKTNLGAGIYTIEIVENQLIIWKDRIVIY